MADDLPTRWAAYLVAGVILLATAAFGGLNDAPPPKTDELASGQPRINDQVALAIDNVVLADGVDEYYFNSDEGSRLLVVVLTVTNLSNLPIAMVDLQDNVTVDVHLPPTTGADESRLHRIEPPRPSAVSGVATDDSGMSRLQPGVPTRVALIWPADPTGAAAIADGSAVTVTIYDLTLGDASLVYHQRNWGDPVAAAHVDLVPDVVGAVSVGAFDGDIP